MGATGASGGGQRGGEVAEADDGQHVAQAVADGGVGRDHENGEDEGEAEGERSQRKEDEADDARGWKNAAGDEEEQDTRETWLGGPTPASSDAAQVDTDDAQSPGGAEVVMEHGDDEVDAEEEQQIAVIDEGRGVAGHSEPSGDGTEVNGTGPMGGVEGYSVARGEDALHASAFIQTVRFLLPLCNKSLTSRRIESPAMRCSVHSKESINQKMGLLFMGCGRFRAAARCGNCP